MNRYRREKKKLIILWKEHVNRIHIYKKKKVHLKNLMELKDILFRSFFSLKHFPILFVFMS